MTEPEFLRMNKPAFAGGRRRPIPPGAIDQHHQQQQ